MTFVLGSSVPTTLTFCPAHGSARTMGGTKRDRKSTRLNSSHGYISYAVFCLKKKNKKNASQRPHISARCQPSDYTSQDADHGRTHILPPLRPSPSSTRKRASRDHSHAT